MKKKYLMNGVAAMALGLVAASCSKDVEHSARDYVANAENALGVTIDSNHDWKMTTETTANITVNKDYGEKYTVKIYSNNPLIDDVAYVLTKGEIVSGSTFTNTFSRPLGSTNLYVGVTDSKGFTSYKLAPVSNNVLTAIFGESASPAPFFDFTRSQAAPAVADIAAPFDEAWVTTYNETAKEPNSENVTDNYDNSVYHEGTPGTYAANYSTIDDWEIWNNMWQHGDWDAQVAWLLANGKDYWLTYTPGTEGYWEYDETFVRNFKITSTYDGAIAVVATEGLTDGVANNNERTVVVTGTWNITADQRVGSKGRIIIANGGTVNVADGVTLNMVNQARLVVLTGGKLTGAGKVEVNNGNAAGEENYNGGTIDVAVFNNNYGKFYNYGKFLVNEYHGGAAESNFYNHALAAIDHFGIYDSSTANARIFNGCQFYVKNDARIRNYEGASGSALIVGGQLMCSSSEDGTSTPTYVSLAAGALVKCGTLYNNGTSWSGPTNGYAGLQIVNQIDFLNWEQDAPATGGYFENNIYVCAGTWDNVSDGNGYHQTDPNDTENYKLSQANYKFWVTVANCRGNNGVTKAIANEAGGVLIAADPDFELGVKGCSPGLNGDPDSSDDKPQVYTFAFEDTFLGDYDMNDVVLQAWEDPDDNTIAHVKLMATGASMDLYVGYNYYLIFNGNEVHDLLNGTRGKFINTGSGSDKFQTGTPTETTITKSAGTSIADLDLWIQAGNNEIHVGSYNPTWQLGSAPFGIVVVGKWAWPKEWTCIKDAYLNFATFAADKTQATDWYTASPVAGSTYYTE